MREFVKAVCHALTPEFKSESWIPLWSILEVRKRKKEMDIDSVRKAVSTHSLTFALLFDISFPFLPAIPRPGGTSITTFH